MARLPAPSKTVLLEHSIVGQAQTSLTINKSQRWAGCKICGAVFQPDIFRQRNKNPTLEEQLQGELEIADWRMRHNKSHSSTQHRQFKASGLALSPEAAHRLAPFGVVSIGDAIFDTNNEINDALGSAPRAPYDDAEGSLKRNQRRVR